MTGGVPQCLGQVAQGDRAYVAIAHAGRKIHLGADLLDALSTGIILLDAQLCPIYANVAAQDLLAFSLNQTRGRPFGDCLYESNGLISILRRALETGAGYAGTVEFFPEEGKYHLDGHRKCAARLTPRETLANEGRCPVCGERVTVGVLHRVEMLADRREEETKPPPSAGKAENLVPLPEVLAEINATGAGSKAVERSYDRLVATLGPGLFLSRSDLRRPQRSFTPCRQPARA